MYIHKIGYPNPANKTIDFPAKIAVVIGTYIPEGQTENVQGRRRCNLDDGNPEYIDFVENKLDLLKFSLACHKHYNPGVEYEIIIADNSSPDQEAKDFIMSQNNITVCSRPNLGFSFGAYEHVWQTFGDKYDYYLFHEQDMVPTHDGWLLEIVSEFLSDKSVGAVGNRIEGPRGIEMFGYLPKFDPDYLGEYFKSDTFTQYNLDGMFAFTSSRILKECGLVITEQQNGEINELFWLHNILNAGYKLIGFADGSYKYTWAIHYVDFDVESDKLAPIMHGQVLYCNQEMRDYFRWYDGLRNFTN